MQVKMFLGKFVAGSRFFCSFDRLERFGLRLFV